MTDDPISIDVRNFILEHIDSVAQLEALLLLRKYPGQDWGAADLANRLYVSEAIAVEVLGRLSADGLLAGKENAYRYNPQHAGTREMIDRLADAYGNYFVAVTNLIHDKPSRIQKFADAFKFRKDK